MMKSKQEYQQEMEAQISSLQTKVDEMKVKAALAKADAKDKYHEQIETLNANCEVAKTKLEELKLSSGNAWEEIKEGLDKAWDELQNAFKRAAEHLQ
jgi:hypothetical protein